MLPSEIWEEILLKTHKPTVTQCSKLNKFFNKLIYHNVVYIIFSEFNTNDYILDREFPFVKTLILNNNSLNLFPNITSLTLNTDITTSLPLSLTKLDLNSRIINIDNLTNLKILENYDCGLKSHLLPTSLTELSLFNAGVNFDIGHLTNLTKLSTGYYCTVTNETITKLVNLTDLDVIYNNNITNDGIKHLTKLVKLKYDHAIYITDEVLKYFQK